jgi:ankyrin repeat protein
MVVLGLIVVLTSVVCAEERDQRASLSTKDFFEAARSGQTTTVDSFLNKGMDIETRDEEIGATALYLASEKGQKGIVETLLVHGAKVNTVTAIGRRTPLHAAATREIAKLLIEKGADVNARAVGGLTPLHTVLFRYDPKVPRDVQVKIKFELIKLLIAKGADPNIKDTYLRASPMDIAVKEGNRELISIFRGEGKL